MTSLTFHRRMAPVFFVCLSAFLNFFPITVTSQSTTTSVIAGPIETSEVLPHKCSGAHVGNSATPHQDCLAALDLVVLNRADDFLDPPLEYTYTRPRCAVRVTFSPPPATGLNPPPLSNLDIRNVVKGTIRLLSSSCILEAHRTAGSATQTYVGPDWYYLLEMKVELRIFGDLNDPYLAHWLAQRRKPAWMNDATWTATLGRKWAEFYYMSNTSVTYP